MKLASHIDLKPFKALEAISSALNVHPCLWQDTPNTVGHICPCILASSCIHIPASQLHVVMTGTHLTFVAGVGGAPPPKKDVHRFVKWPKYVRIQRQRRVLNQRLKVGDCYIMWATATGIVASIACIPLFQRHHPTRHQPKLCMPWQCCCWPHIGIGALQSRHLSAEEIMSLSCMKFSCLALSSDKSGGCTGATCAEQVHKGH